jgi:hypothetical protein
MGARAALVVFAEHVLHPKRTGKNGNWQATRSFQRRLRKQGDDERIVPEGSGRGSRSMARTSCRCGRTARWSEGGVRARVRTGARNRPPSYLHGHSGISRASSRHSGVKWRLREGGADLGHASARLLGRPRDPLVPGRRLQTHAPAGSCWSAVGDHAAASMDGHVPQAADRLASARARRAAAAPAVRSAGTASPLPKYISSGVCP